MTRRAWSRRPDGWLLILGGLGVGLVLWLAPAAGATSRDGEARDKHDFNSVVRAIEVRYQVRGKPVPMMWLANFCASRFTNGGVRGMKVVEFEDAGRIASSGGKPGEFGELVRMQLGERWSPMVRQHEKDGKDSYVYIQSADESKSTRMIVVDLDGEELDMVRLTLNPQQLARWMKLHNSDVETKSSGQSSAND